MSDQSRTGLLAITGGWMLAVAGCVAWLDRPAAQWVHHHAKYRAVFAALTYTMYPVMAFVCLYLVGYGVRALFPGRKSWRPGTTMACCLATAAALTLCDALKVVFGRTGPETFDGNLSWFRDGIHGFFPFHSGVGYAFFPSGHIAIFSAFAGVLWHRVPRLRIVSAAVIVSMMVGLYGADWHWLSDILAGLGLGLFCAKATVRLLSAPPSPD